MREIRARGFLRREDAKNREREAQRLAEERQEALQRAIWAKTQDIAIRRAQGLLLPESVGPMRRWDYMATEREDAERVCREGWWDFQKASLSGLVVFPEFIQQDSRLVKINVPPEVWALVMLFVVGEPW